MTTQTTGTNTTTETDDGQTGGDGAQDFTLSLPEGAAFCLYGPFAYGGEHTSESNARFDAMLRQRDPASGIRDMRDLEKLGESVGLGLEADHAMPANNRTLVWRRV